MGHLFYTELGDLGYVATDGTYPQTGWGLNNTGDFNNLLNYWYWSGTWSGSSPDDAWLFDMDFGLQNIYKMNDHRYGLAVRGGKVSVAPVPEPATILLLGPSLIVLLGFGRKSKK